MLSHGYDWLAFGGFALGIVALHARPRAHAQREAEPVLPHRHRAGRRVPDREAPPPDFPLVAPQGDDFVFNFGHGMEGEMVVNGQSTSLAELAAQGRTHDQPDPGGREDSASRAGKTTFLVSAVAAAAPPCDAAVRGAREPRARVLRGLARRAPRLLAAARSRSRSRTRRREHRSRVARGHVDISSQQHEPGRPPPPEEEDKPDDGADESGGTGTAMALDEGKMGKKDSDRAEGQYKMQKTNEDPQLARQQAIERPRTAGILGSTALRFRAARSRRSPARATSPAASTTRTSTVV